MQRIMYKSRSTGPVTWELIHAILEPSERNNARDQVTGILLASETHYLQVLEGPSEAVNSTFQRIARDPRHCELDIIENVECEERLFGQWAMHDVGVFAFNQALTFELAQRYGDDEGGVLFPTEPDRAMGLIQDILQRDR